MDAFSLREQGAYSHVVAFGMLGERNGRSAYEHHVGDDRSHELISTLAACVGHGGELLLGPELLGKSIQKSAKEARTRMRALRGHPTLAGEFTLLYAIHDRCNLVTVFRRHNN